MIGKRTDRSPSPSEISCNVFFNTKRGCISLLRRSDRTTRQTTKMKTIEASW
ncbi:hypothetical protein V12B01_13525 [Vibrio splendidus 12B01]|nr:hypothetical protein V12B01_13525 [Vibrio splendidus 12B01]